MTDSRRQPAWMMPLPASHNESSTGGFRRRGQLARGPSTTTTHPPPNTATMAFGIARPAPVPAVSADKGVNGASSHTMDASSARQNAQPLAHLATADGALTGEVTVAQQRSRPLPSILLLSVHRL